MRIPARWLPVLALGMLPSRALAAPDRAAIAVTPKGGGQPAMAVGFDASGDLRAKLCAAAPCTPDGGVTVPVPQSAKARIPEATLRVARLGQGRTVAVVTIPSGDGASAWEAVLAAPVRGNAPVVVFSGATGFVEGIEGERSGPMIHVDADHVYIGRQAENRSLCGRPVILAPEVVHPDTLALAPVKLQRLGEKERSGATRVEAVAAQGERAAPVLKASWATSAAAGHSPSALTDGDPDTAWVEGRGGSGRGEFVVMLAPKELPISGFELVLRPTGASDSGLTSPSEFWIATDDRLVHVTAPPTLEGRLAVPLDTPVQTGCVALVLEDAGGGSEARIAVAEIAATTTLSNASTDDLIGALNAGGAEAAAAAAALRTSGPEAFASVASAFSRLSPEGQRAALDVMDHAPCDQRVPVLVEGLLSPRSAVREVVRERIRDCREAAAPALVVALGRASDKHRGLIAEELAMVGPETAVTALVGKLARASAEVRRAYRVALASASRAATAQPAIVEALQNPAHDPVATIDLLRALGPRVRAYPEAAKAAFARLATPTASFRTRFLLLGVASELAATDPNARAFLQNALSRDASHHVRAQAARVVRDTTPFRDALLASLEDPGVRVREAAVKSLGTARASYAATALARRLDDDPWPLVRSAAARALGRLTPSASIEEALVNALDDESPAVRRPAVLALGDQRAVRAAPKVRDLLGDDEEMPAVRAAAAQALGMMCDHASVDLLTDHARDLADPHNALRDVSQSALTALAWIHPPDLADRIAPLRARGVSVGVRRAADAALQAPPRCRPRGKR